jgi:hypothetical protein
MTKIGENFILYVINVISHLFPAVSIWIFGYDKCYVQAIMTTDCQVILIAKLPGFPDATVRAVNTWIGFCDETLECEHKDAR